MSEICVRYGTRNTAANGHVIDISLGPSSQTKIWEVKSTLFSPAGSFMTDKAYP